jgi:hypothetical protein
MPASLNSSRRRAVLGWFAAGVLVALLCRISGNVSDVPTNEVRVLAPVWPLVLPTLAAAVMTRRAERSPG